jgi:hypothetical protein
VVNGTVFVLQRRALSSATDSASTTQGCAHLYALTCKIAVHFARQAVAAFYSYRAALAHRFFVQRSRSWSSPSISFDCVETAERVLRCK